MSETKINNALSQIINSGSNKMLFEEIKEKRKFDLGWIKTLEKWLPNVERAAEKIRQAIKVEQEVIPIEKVKMVDSSSIRHLAANSNNVQRIDRDGLVIPSKLLSSFKIEDYGVYENRFLKTLINRLYRYVNVRYNSIRKNYESYLRRELEVDSNFNYNRENVSVKVSLSSRTDVEFDAQGESIEKIISRLDRIKLIVNALKYSQFMKLTANEKEISPPVVRTNAIMKNVDLIAAYSLWGFIDRETALKFDIDHNSTKLKINSRFQEDVLEIVGDVYRKYRLYLFEKRVNYAALSKFKNKKPKIVDGFSGKFVISDEELKMENTQVSEYYLQQITEKMGQTYKDFIINGKSRQDAAKRVFRELLMVADTIYDNIDFEQNPDSQDDQERLKYFGDRMKILEAYVDVKSVNLRKHERDLASLKTQYSKVATVIKNKEEREAKQKALLIMKQKRQKEREKARLALIAAKLKEKAAKEKEKEIALQKVLKEKEKIEKEKQKLILLEKIKIEKEEKLKQKEKLIIEKQKLLYEEKLREKAKKESEKIARLEEKRIEIEKQKAFKKKQKEKILKDKLKKIEQSKKAEKIKQIRENDLVDKAGDEDVKKSNLLFRDKQNKEDELSQASKEDKFNSESETTDFQIPKKTVIVKSESRQSKSISIDKNQESKSITSKAQMKKNRTTKKRTVKVE